MIWTMHGFPNATPALHIDDGTIQENVSRAAFAAGRDYASRGRVTELVVSDDGATLRAQTRGSAGKLYRQHITLMYSKGRISNYTGTCTCPVAFYCKHVAAVLFAVRKTPPPAAPAPPTEVEAPLPYNVQYWLQLLDSAPDVASDIYPETIRQRLLYVLSTAPDHRPNPSLHFSCASVMLRKNGSFGQVRSYLSHQVDTPAKYLRPTDKTILRRLARMRYQGSDLGLDDDPQELLRRIIATGRARWDEPNGPVITEGPARPGRIAWQLNADGSQQASLALDDGLVGFVLGSAWYADPNSGAIGKLEFDLPQAVVTHLLSAPSIPAEMIPRVAAELARRLPASAPMPTEMAPPTVLRGPVMTHLRFILGAPILDKRFSTMHGYAQPEQPGVPMVRLAFGYGPVMLPFGRQQTPPVMAIDGRLYLTERDAVGERDAVARLGGIGFARVGEMVRSFGLNTHWDDFLLDDGPDGAEWIDVMLHEVPALVASGWQIDIDPDFPVRLVTADNGFEAELIEGSGIDWLELHLGVMLDGQRVDLVPTLVRLIRGLDSQKLLDGGDEPFLIPLPDGRLLSLPIDSIRPTLLALIELFAGGGIDPDTGKITFTRHDAADLAALEDITGVVWQGGDSLRALGRQLREGGGSIPPVQLPPTFHGSLRPYQEQGVAWLQFLREASLGGVLADDMGLGKTVQTLAHLLIEQAAGRLDRPALIVCPTSLIPNWVLEAQRFAPGLKLLALHGPKRRERFAEIIAHDLVLTTYPLLTRDHETLIAQDWHAVILDEAQVIKNPAAETTRQALRLQARQRICLSGTPLQNHLGELWSLFDFLAPGFLGSSRAFRNRYRTPIEKHGDIDRQRMLGRRVRPFLLRRTKDQVLQDLPPKTEIPEWVEMEAGQRALYDGIRLAMHTKVKAAIAERGLARSGIIILDALLKLRQACCDPRLLKLKAARQAGVGTAKLDRLMALLDALLGEGRRVLIFSQFTSMLALIEAQLQKAGIDYVLLTGNTTDRTTPVRQFQTGEIPVFLISLKAGGVGLNLTAADTVIHYDPWWNPAVEDQATDRAHRIGQDKKVFVHRLVTLATIEEKMEALKDKKRALVASVLDAENGGALKLTEADIEDLFAAG